MPEQFPHGLALAEIDDIVRRLYRYMATDGAHMVGVESYLRDIRAIIFNSLDGAALPAHMSDKL